MPVVSSLFQRPGIQAVFVPGRPARTGHLALWHPTLVPDSFTETLDLVLPAGSTVRHRTVPATFIPVAAAIDALVGLHVDHGAGAATHGWAAVARGALLMIARGRLLPTVDDDGVDSWRIGPLDPDDLVYREALADALPPSAYATAIAGSAPRRVSSPRWLVARFWDAVADAYVRTAAAPLAAGHEAFADQGATTARLVAPGGPAGVGSWLNATASSVAAQASVALRLVADGDPTAAIDSDDESDDSDAGAEASGVEASAVEPSDLDASELLHPNDDSEPSGDEARSGMARSDSIGPDTSPFRAVLEVGSVADRSLVLDAAALWTAPGAVMDRFGPTVEDDVLLALRRGARVWAPVARLLEQARPDAIDLTGEEVADLLGPIADELSGSGIEVRWPTTVMQGIDLRPVVVSESVSSDRAGTLDFASMCELRWRASIDGEELTDAEIDMLVDAKRGVVRLRGRWVKADPARLARLKQRRAVTAGEALAAALSGELTIDGDELAAEVQGPLADLGARLATHEATDRSAWMPPEGLHADLRPYQREGAAWLEEMADLGLGGVLADDMGLGKTLQFLALHLARRRHGLPTLVICPVSVLGNWAREAARFTPGVPVVRYHGTDRDLDGLPADALVITTYAMVRRDLDAFVAQPWGLVAADEAQAAKNPLSRTARAIRQIPSGARFALTGTPVENRLVDLWALLDWTTPGLLGPLQRFRREVAVPIERERDDEAAATLARLVRPFVLRRRKSDPDIAPDLPPKTETDAVVPLTVEQRTLYQAMVAEVMAQVEAAEGISRRGLVLKLLTGLKQICNHPAQFLKQDGGTLGGRSGKLDAATELVETITSEGEAVLVFTQFVSMGHMLEAHLAAPDRPVQFLHGSVPVAKRQEMVDRFQAGEVPVFVISVKAGGTGLNLTQATHVIHYDRWWNPAVEDQASDRAWRIGQDRPVQVHRMVCEGTVEDKISVMLAEKRALAEAVVTSGEGWVSDLGDDDLRLLVSLGADD